MPMRELSVVEQREAFVGLATMIGANRSGLCREFGISRKTGYKWLGRHRLAGDIGLVDRSRRPHTSPLRTDEATETAVLGIRAASNNAWGARKIAWTLAVGAAIRSPCWMITRAIRWGWRPATTSRTQRCATA